MKSLIQSLKSTIGNQSFDQRQVILVTFCTLILVDTLNCYLYSVITANEDVSFFESLIRATSRWGGWIIVAPMVILQAHKLLEIDTRNQAVNQLLMIIIAFSLGESLLLATLALWQIDEPVNFSRQFYNTMIRELPVIVSITFILSGLIVFQSRKRQLPESRSDSFEIRTPKGTRRIAIDSLESVSAAGNYMELATDCGKRYLYRATMKAMQNTLDEKVFIRIHRSHIVNRFQVRELQTGSHGDYQLLLSTGRKLPVSRQYAKRIQNEFASNLKAVLLSA